MNRLRIFKQTVASVLAISIVSCGETADKPQAKAENVFSDEFLSSVETYEVTTVAVKREMKLTGKVDYDPDKIVRYKSLLGGTVQSTDFNIGDKVQKGQRMATVKSPELGAMQAEKQKLETEIEVLRRDLASTQNLYEDNLSSHKELLEVQSRLKQAETEVEKVKTNLSLYGSSGNGGAFTIKAPITGFVIEKNIAAGAQISPENEALFVVADLSTVWIMANVYAGDLAAVKRGMSVDIKTLSWPGEMFHGKIDAVSQVFDAEEHVLKARIAMPNNEMKFRPEMAVDLTLKLNDETKMTAMPTKATVFDDNRYFAVIQKGNDFVIGEIEPAGQKTDTSYVSSGLEAGDLVVVKNQLLMYNKLKGN